MSGTVFNVQVTQMICVAAALGKTIRVTQTYKQGVSERAGNAEGTWKTVARSTYR